MTGGSPARTLVLDENLNPRLATEIARRGRDATRVQELGLRGSADPQLLVKLEDQLDDWILITADDGLPLDHGDTLAEVGGTVATIEPAREWGWDLEPWRREIVHRWVHVMHMQQRGTARRYGLSRHAPWGPRRHRPPRP